jgi:hypothetical protein
LGNCAYLLKGARPFINSLLKLVDVATVDAVDDRFAIRLPMADLEDALQAAVAVAWKADFNITRNLHDYGNSPIPANSPAEEVSRHLTPQFALGSTGRRPDDPSRVT